MGRKKKEKWLYLKLIGILIIPLILLGLYAVSTKEIGLKNITLQKFPLHSSIHTYSETKEVFPLDTLQIEKDSSSSVIICDTTSQRILLLGDSMVEGLSKRLQQYVAENNHDLQSVIWYSSSTKIWSESDTLTHFIKNYAPTYIMVCLGGNELFVKDLEKRKTYIKTIIEKIDNIPFIWIGPPNWKEDTGINYIIEELVGTARYFPSKNLTYKRASDGAHPTMASAAMWMDSIAVWIDNCSHYRIQLDFPTTQNRKGKNVLLMPLK